MARDRFSPELRERAVRMVLDHTEQYPIAVGGDQLDRREDRRARLKRLERENFGLKRANKILKKASAYFAQAELDRADEK